MFKSMFAAAAISAALATTPAIAGEAQGESVSVSYHDLNLATEQGQKKLEQRLERAAQQACGVDGVRTDSRITPPDQSRCLNEARKSAKAQFAQIVSEQQLGG